jgi:signal transduction histidine kinase
MNASLSHPQPKSTACTMRIFLSFCAVCAVSSTSIGGIGADERDATPTSTCNRVTVAELRGAVTEAGRITRSFEAEGVVCAVVRENNYLVLQDDSGAVLLHLPALDPAISTGQRVSIRARDCLLTRNRAGIEVGTAPVVDNDGNHPATTKSGSIRLAAGRHPFRLEWYNGDGALALKLEYQGPGIRRQTIPPRSFSHRRADSAAMDANEPGLQYASYVGPASPPWPRLPNFRQLTPAAAGVAEAVDMMYRLRDLNSALLFTGFLEVTNSGNYTFYLNSDDGSRLEIGDQAGSCEVESLNHDLKPIVGNLNDTMPEQSNHGWTEFDGVVTFADDSGATLELEVSAMGERIQAAILAPADLTAAGLLGRRVRGIGLCELPPERQPRRRAFFVVPSSEQMRVLGPSKDAPAWDVTDTVLTSADQIMGLKREDARQGIPAKLTGVITWAAARALVIHDGTAGIYVHFFAQDWIGQPRVGEIWELDGKTDGGDFSPVMRASNGRFLGNGIMPEPIHPTWDQLMNGSLDAQYVEVHGVVTSVSKDVMTLLTTGGKLRIVGSSARPLPCAQSGTQLPTGTGVDHSRVPGPEALLDCLVRIRGCLTAQWEPATRQLKAGEVFLSPSLVSIEQPAPADAFSLPVRKISDLLLFDANASALQRTKIAAQVIHAQPPEYILYDGQMGTRVRAREAVELAPGALVEAVGFPQLGGPSPVLQEAMIRQTGSASLPEPLSITANELLSGRHDSKLVRVQATLVNDTTYGRQRNLELRADARHFRARLRRDPKANAFEPGTRLELVGVCAAGFGERAGEAANAFELLVNEPAGLHVLQQPPWLTPRRAAILAIALGGGLAAALVWVTLLRRKVDERTRQLQKQIEARQVVEQRRAMEEERSRVAQDLHDELGAGLTEVSILGSLAKNPAVSPEKKDLYLDQLTNAARALITELDEIVWAVNPHYDSVGSLASYYSLFGQRFLNLAGIPCRLHIAEQFPDHPLDSKVRHGIFLAFKEALNNIVRHSGATEVELKIEVARERLVIVVSDNGCGLLSMTSAPGHDGLASMQQRLRKLGGSCSIRSEPGCGTTVEFQLPLLPPLPQESARPIAPEMRPLP